MLKRILIVDDNTEHLDVLKEALSYFNFFIQTSCDGRELLSLVETFKPDLLLLDYILPGDNGVELCQKIKNYAPTNHIPVILMSGYLGV